MHTASSPAHPVDRVTPPPGRMLFIDNIRWMVIVFVVIVHLAVTYSGIGSWYYKEGGRLDPISLVAFAFLETHLQAFFMGLLFLIAGYFVPGAYDRKGAGKFMADRLLRLGAPTLLYMLVVDPFISVCLLHSLRNQPGTSFLAAYGHYVGSLEFVGRSGPLWFAFALLIFCGVYALARLARGDRRPTVAPAGAPPGQSSLLALIALLSVGAFLVRIIQPIGTSVLNMQLCFFTQYVVLFVLGILIYRGNWLARVPRSLGYFWLRLGSIAGPAIWLTMMFMGGATSGDFAPFCGGLRWQSAAYATWESFFCVATCLGLLVWFRESFDRQDRFAKFMSENAFAVYVFHAPIIIALAQAFSSVSLPPWLKFLLLCIVSLPICFLFAHLVPRRIPGLRRIL